MKLSAKFDWEVTVRWKAKPEQLQVELDRQWNPVRSGEPPDGSSNKNRRPPRLDQSGSDTAGPPAAGVLGSAGSRKAVQRAGNKVTAFQIA